MAAGPAAMSQPPSRWHDIAQRPWAIAGLIAGFTALRLVLAATLPLLPEEAYYWSWSRHLDWSTSTIRRWRPTASR